MTTLLRFSPEQWQTICDDVRATRTKPLANPHSGSFVEFFHYLHLEWATIAHRSAPPDPAPVVSSELAFLLMLAKSQVNNMTIEHKRFAL